MSVALYAAVVSLLLAQPDGLAGSEQDTDAVAPAIVAPTLIGEMPQIKGLPTRRGVQIRVVLEVVIDVEGRISELIVIKSAGPIWDNAVTAAAKALRFQPATRDGVPIAVRVNIPFTMGDVTPLDARGRIKAEPDPVVKGVALTGRVLEKGTRKPLAGITVFLEGTDVAVISDAFGRYEFKDLVKGKGRLVIPAFDYEEKIEPVRIPTEGDIDLWLEPRSTQRYKTVARGKTGDASRILISVEQAREVAGTSGDPLKVLESLPGVARPASAGPGAGALAVRGSAPEDTRFYVDGLPLFQLYHFGNLYSVIQDEWIGAIDFRPGGFSAEYGNATGGFLGITLRDLPQDGVHGHIDVNTFHTAALLTVPVSDDWTLGFAFRRSYIDLILSAIFADSESFSFTAAPRYYDYQFRVDYKPNSRTNARFLVFGSDDLFTIVLNEPSDNDPNLGGFSFGRIFHQIQGTLTTGLTDTADLYVGLMTGYQTLDITPGDLGFSLRLCPLTLRSHVTYRGVDKLTLRAGVLGTIQDYGVYVNLPAPPKEGEVVLPLSSREIEEQEESGLGGEAAAWFEANWRPAKAWNVIGGLRLNAWMGNFLAAGLDPRLTVRYEVLEGTELMVAGGMNHQAPTPDETSRSVGTKGLGPERSVYATLGVRQDVGDYLVLSLQGFYKHLFDLVSPTGNELTGDRYNNGGVGYVVGGEFLARLNSDWVDGWVAYTLSRSIRRDQPGEPERLFSFDQTHVLAVVAGLKLPHGWRIGARFRYTTGNPYTPLQPGYYDAASDVWVPRPAGPPLSARVDDYIQLDVRIDKRFVFNNWKLKLYIELQNATNQKNTEFVNYTYDYRVRDDVAGLPIIPSLGIRGSF